MKEKLKNIFKNYGFFLWPVLVVVVALVILIKIDLPKISEINLVRKKLSGVQEKLAKLGTKSSLLKGLDENKLKEDLGRTSQVLPDGKDTPGILRTLENSSSVSGIFLEDLNLAPGKIATYGATPSAAREKPNEIPLKVSVSGKIPQITLYLSKIVSTGRALGLRNLEMTFSEGTASAKANLELTAFFLPSPYSVAKTDESLPAWGAPETETMAKISQREILVPLPITPGTGKTNLFE